MTTLLAVACGMMVGLGLYLAVRGARRAPIRLDDALENLSRRASLTAPEPALGLEGWGDRVRRRLRLPLTAAQQRYLLHQGRSVGDFFVEKLVWTVTGAALPLVWCLVMAFMGRGGGLLPLGLSVPGAVLGYFVADLRLRTGAKQARRRMADGIGTFFDLVVLERLANASAAQATANAAAVSDAPLFRRITAGLERARMEQTQPWNELRLIAEEWECPELKDFADVMQLEEQGTGLTGALRARVKELRDEHLTRQKTQAQAASEAMTIWMTIPAMLLGVALVTPALLGLLG